MHYVFLGGIHGDSSYNFSIVWGVCIDVWCV